MLYTFTIYTVCLKSTFVVVELIKKVVCMQQNKFGPNVFWKHPRSCFERRSHYFWRVIERKKLENKSLKSNTCDIFFNLQFPLILLIPQWKCFPAPNYWSNVVAFAHHSTLGLCLFSSLHRSVLTEQFRCIEGTKGDITVSLSEVCLSCHWSDIESNSM